MIDGRAGTDDFGAAPAQDEFTEAGRRYITDNFYTPSGICEADWNNDETLNTLDFLAFLSDFTASHYRADLNVDGTVNTLDFLAFLNIFVAGCP